MAPKAGLGLTKWPAPDLLDALKTKMWPENKPKRIFYIKEFCLLSQCVFVDLPQCTIIIEDIKLPAKAAPTKSFSSLYGQISERYSRQTSLWAGSTQTTIDAKINAPFGTDKQQLFTWSCTNRQTKIRSGRLLLIDFQVNPLSRLTYK